LATTREAAFLGATKVRVTYENIETPVVKIEESLEEARTEGKMESLQVRTAKSPKEAVEAEPKHVISGKFQIGGQHHFQMEPHSTLCIPTENGLRVYSATQWIDNTQAMLSSALKLPVNKYGRLHNMQGVERGSFRAGIFKCRGALALQIIVLSNMLVVGHSNCN
jgi:xanthine dehydrogenase/oxidase